MSDQSAISLGVSVVLYKTPMSKVAPLLADLQRAGAAKIFLIDNSPPGFDDKLDNQHQRAPVDRVCTGRNLGYGKAHNIGIRQCADKYKYHLICNPDIAIPEQTLTFLTKFMEANPDVGLCMPRLVGTDGGTQFCCRRSPLFLDYLSQILSPRVWGRRRRDELEMRSRDYHSQMEVECLSGCFMFFRSDVLRRLGGFDERFFLYFEDFDLSIRSKALARNVYVPAVHVVHERQSAHRKSWWLKLIFARSAFLYFSKWGWFSARVHGTSPRQ
jgi:GT2 family glycosyltransferase